MPVKNNRNDAHRPPLAVVIGPAGRRPRLGLGPWLRTRYGIEQIQTVTLSHADWNGLASDVGNPSALNRLKYRLALSLLSRPELVVIAGHPTLDAQWDAWPRSQRDVERILHLLLSWELPVELLGVWVNERSDADTMSPQWLAEAVPARTRAARCWWQ